MREKKLLSLLMEKQRGENLNDTEFANKLGISRSLWRQTRTGEREINQTLLAAVMKVYPELAPEILTFLRDSEKEEV